MSCERRWWDYLSRVNAHIAAVEELARLAEAYSPESRSIFVVTPADLHELLDAIARVDTTLRDQRLGIEAVFHALEEHGPLGGNPAIGPTVTW